MIAMWHTNLFPDHPLLAAIAGIALFALGVYCRNQDLK
jgi:hypothetical protein